jgi:demethylmenaquinone methyltransferase/2-methoxy-6-polyprenyl-1,4-benzoquinol methylase
MSAQYPVKTPGSGAMFDGIARRYDFLNRLMSFGLDGRWRRRLVDALGAQTLPPNAQVLDVATGTADVALALLRARHDLHITGLDPSAAMLDQAATKRGRAGYREDQLKLCEGDAQAMPFADHTFAASCISFGIRNVPDRLRGLQEMARVTATGGRVVVLELGEPQDGLLRPLARWHVHTLVPFLGGLISGSKEYRYLQQSIRAFPAPADFAKLMGQAGLQEVTVTRLSFGALHLYTGRAP